MRKVYLILLVLGLALLAFFLPVASLQLKLKDVSIKEIKYSDRLYSLKSGWVNPIDSHYLSVLRLAAFYQWTKEDPLFYSPDLDVEEFSHSVDLLSKEHDKLIGVFGWKKHLHPVNFLQSMSEVSALTKEFLDNPSDKLAQNLLEKQKLVAKNYGREARDLLDVLNQYEFQVVGFSISVQHGTVRGDLQKIIENGEKLQAGIERRERCLLTGNPCERPALGFAEPKEMIGEDEEVATLSKSLVFNSPESALSQMTIRGPYKVNTICFGWGKDFSIPTHSFFLEERTSPLKRRESSPLINLPLLNIQLATEVFFKRLKPSTAVAVHKELLGRDVKIIHFPSTNPYMCPERGFLAEISELDAFKHTMKPVFPKINAGPGSIEHFFARANEVEKIFFAKESPSYEDLLLLSDYYGYAYKLIVDYPGADWSKKLSHLKEEFLERNLRAKRKLDNTHLIFNESTRFVNSLWVRHFLEKDVDLPGFQRYTYSWRNFYGLYFFPFTASVWRMDAPLQYIDKTIVKDALGPDASYMTYQQARERYSQEELSLWSTTTAHRLLEELLLDVVQ